MKYDFCGWATKNNVRCADGRTIIKDAFINDDGKKVPLVWMHKHGDPSEVLGHAILENRDEGVYAYCSFNKTKSGNNAKELVKHGDVESLSIFANDLKESMSNVIHGKIREVSLVLAGANPEANIESVVCHGVEYNDEVNISFHEPLSLFHSGTSDDEEKGDEMADNKKPQEDDNKKPQEDDKTIEDIINSMTDEQKDALYYLVGLAREDNSNDEDDEVEGGKMKHNLFDDYEENNDEVLAHEAEGVIIGDAKRCGSMRESFIQHAEDYGIENIDILFPDATSVENTPGYIKRDTGWVGEVMGTVSHSPFARIKSIFADITEDEARAKGYIKGKYKKEEVFSLLKRVTHPTTVYKKQKMDRDDVKDITSFDVIAFLKSEMRLMLDEEIARAILVGDGRLASLDDKIDEDCIRPIWKDEDLFTIKSTVEVAEGSKFSDVAAETIDQSVRAMAQYKGSGKPTAFMADSLITEMLLLKDGDGKRIYKSIEEIATAMRVNKIISVPVMENLKRSDGTGNNYDLLAIIVNLADYKVGADKGGSVDMFEDFDINYNQQLYLIETRCSGALFKPYSAIVLEKKAK